MYYTKNKTNEYSLTKFKNESNNSVTVLNPEKDVGK